jgi:hypothetical protein
MKPSFIEDIEDVQTEMPSNSISIKEQPTHDEIAALAFEYSQLRAGSEGDDIADWLRAERHLIESRASESAADAPSSQVAKA